MQTFKWESKPLWADPYGGLGCILSVGPGLTPGLVALMNRIGANE